MPQFSVEGGPEENCAARLYAGASVRFTDVGGLGTSVAKDWVGLVRLLQGFHFAFYEVTGFLLPGVSLKAHRSTCVEFRSG